MDKFFANRAALLATGALSALCLVYISSLTTTTISSAGNSAAVGAPPSKRLAAAHAFLKSYKDLSPDSLLRHMSPEFSHQVLPTSMGMPTRDRAAFAGHAKMFTSIFTEFEMQPRAVYEDAARNVVVAYCFMVGELARGLGRHETECVLVMHMDAAGAKVALLQEFVDSAKGSELKEKLSGSMGKQGMDHVMHK